MNLSPHELKVAQAFRKLVGNIDSPMHKGNPNQELTMEIIRELQAEVAHSLAKNHSHFDFREFRELCATPIQSNWNQ